ncbi:MAG TPA: hypothetical protein VML50_17260 [Anaeromyxobacter sp.]|nr:hypothetical protein [Anaeromyxobacter sp.]
MVSRILAFRPASVVERLGPRNDACPLSLRDLLGPAAGLPLTLPVVRAPIAGVARAALVAAKEARSALGLALPPGVPPEPWFEAVTEAADEVAAGLPIFLSAEVAVEGEAAMQVERARHEAWRLLDAGVTHLAVDVGAVEVAERGRVLSEVAQGATERGICVDCVVPLEPLQGSTTRRAVDLFEDLARRGVPPDVASVRCRAPADVDEARGQVATLSRICSALSGVPVMRRGPVIPDLLGLLAGSPVKACEDGGAAATCAISLLPWEVLGVEVEERRRSRIEEAAAALSAEAADRLEARAYVEVSGFVERLGAAGSAPALIRALEDRLAER